jgi:hypothetical protein
LHAYSPTPAGCGRGVRRRGATGRGRRWREAALGFGLGFGVSGLGDPPSPPDLEAGPRAAAGPAVVAGCGRNGGWRRRHLPGWWRRLVGQGRRRGQAVGEIREGGVEGEGQLVGGGGGRRWWGSTPERREMIAGYSAEMAMGPTSIRAGRGRGGRWRRRRCRRSRTGVKVAGARRPLDSRRATTRGGRHPARPQHRDDNARLVGPTMGSSVAGGSRVWTNWRPLSV